jgi:hypothetical protein
MLLEMVKFLDCKIIYTQVAAQIKTEISMKKITFGFRNVTSQAPKDLKA